MSEMLPENLELYGKALRAAIDDLHKGVIDVSYRLEEYHNKAKLIGKLGEIPGQRVSVTKFTTDIMTVDVSMKTVQEVEKILDEIDAEEAAFDELN